MDYDPSDEKKAIDDAKAGVKGLVDSGIVEIPRIFIRPPHELAEELNMCKSTLQVPVVDLSGIHVEDGRKKIVDEIREASEKWGLFQLINHGIPSSVLEGMIDETRKFHEQDVEVKKEYYSSDPTARQVRYDCNLHVNKTKGKIANWKDTLYISELVSGHIEPEEIPQVCRKTSVEYINHVVKLEDILLGLLSEALGLRTNHLKDTECDKRQLMVCHYYPACPQPELTLGTEKHTDPVFVTILLQDQNGGLQVMCDNQWTDVTPIEHGLVVNIGDLLQILSNDKFVSAIHRVVARNAGPRISVACFFSGVSTPPKTYGPIKELIWEENPPLYKEFQVVDYVTKYFSKPLDKTGLDLFRL
uniref:Desacetoxyvindoline 4-hydroxylase n=1 Tax=Solanum tuberosum TaxID=4113 RepID=M1BG57_SOLTU